MVVVHAVDSTIDIGSTGIIIIITTTTTATRPHHSMKLIKYQCSIDATKYYFSNRIVNIWNLVGLPNDMHLLYHLSNDIC